MRLNRKSYSRLSPLAERLLGISTEAVFLLTRNCSSKFRPLICLMKDCFISSSSGEYQMTELHRFRLKSA